MKTVFYRTFTAIFLSDDKGNEEVVLQTTTFKHVSYEAFRNIFKNRAKNVIGVDAVVEYVNGTDRRYSYWRWSLRHNGKSNVWQCLSGDKLYRKLIINDDRIKLTNGI